MSSHPSDQMSQRSQVSRFTGSVVKTLIVSLVRQTDQGTRSPIELFWAAKNKGKDFLYKLAKNFKYDNSQIADRKITHTVSLMVKNTIVHLPLAKSKLHLMYIHRKAITLAA